MVDRYCREIKSIKDNIESSLKISGILLKLKGYDENLSGIDTNEGAISSNLGKINTNEGAISSNLGKINTNEGAISSNLGKINTNEGAISSNLKKINANTSDVSSNKTKVNNIENDTSIRINKDIYEKTFIISIISTNYNTKKIADINIKSNFSRNGIIRINANYNYSYDDTNNFSHICKFYNDNQKFKEIKLNHKSNILNDKFDIPGVNSTRISLLIYLVNNNNNNSLIKLFDHNTVKIIYNDMVDTSKLDMNTDNISTNSTKIKDNLTEIENIRKYLISKKHI